MNKPIRHGESLLYPTEKAFRGKKVKTVIVAHSETGHHHVLDGEMKIKQSDKEFLIELFSPGVLSHKKQVDAHKTLTIPAGKYRVIKKSEYDPWQGVIREVHD